MHDALIRASLDQSLLALEALEAGEWERAHAHAALATAMKFTEPSHANATKRHDDVVIAGWLSDIRVLSMASQAPTAPVEARPVQNFVPDPLMDMPVGRRRAAERRGEV